MSFQVRLFQCDSAPKKSLFPPQQKLPSFNKSKTSSSAPLSPVPPVKVENYCDDTLQYPVKAESPVIANSSLPARKRSGGSLRDPLPRKRQEVFNAPRVKVESLPPFHEKLGGSLSDHGRRK
ncbi:uncharacterized protein ARMOST_03134 [Armillaria ostoyae]|uniref:Uncharacterized protein n=1 Tax=Armillaria ostoyae TaxID=47428 RepID=A0A284QTS6_ARMOS|nr:uncharacterized protein ARMOST_03134 [Armillaria ostoyae]